MSATPTPTVRYFAVSVLSSRTMWFAVLTFLAGVLALPEFVALIPVRYTPVLLMIGALVQLWLRSATVRPVAFVAPGETKVIEVAKLAPPPALTD
jgi:predicted CDP-diglyceride synthetase/phosphatidate cytidylyltransferase